MFKRFQRSTPTIPPGHRIYAIGDIHGEAALLRRLLLQIKEDSAMRRDGSITLVFLGDIVDRGTDAADLLRVFAQMDAEHVVVLKGNHEAALVQAYHGDHEVLSEWLPFGATATLAGFGVTPAEIDAPPDDLAAALRAKIDSSLIEWIDALPCAWECGDYYFTHAGVRPGVNLSKQDERDLLWIREPFLSSGRWHGKVVVHGHTIEPGVPSLGGNRIGVDTGAHEHGVLTAVGLEGGRQWVLQATADQSDDVPDADIPALIAAIVAPEPQPADSPLLLHTPLDDTLGLSTPRQRARKLGNRGVVAVGFALVVAAIGGAIAIGTSWSPLVSGNVSLAVPEAIKPTATPAAPSAGSAIARKASVRSKPRLQPDTVTDGASPRLYGAELERALEEDRATTRRLNQDELSRLHPMAPSVE